MQAIAYDASRRVTSYSNGVGTWGYCYAPGNSCNALVSGTPSVTITDPNGDRRTVVSNPSLDVITSSTDALGRTTSYVYDNGQANGPGHLTQVNYPHGNSVQYVYDSNGNVTTTTQVPASGSGLSNIVTSASYPCATVATCNKPSSTTDARGNVTTYTYDTSSAFVAGGSGVLLSVTRPAQGPNNVQPQTRYSYTALQTSGGTASPIYLLTSVSTCNTASASSCIGTADETRITIGYDASHNLAPASVTAAAGDGSISSTQSFAYDSVGNLYTSTSPLGAVTRYRYDADRELVGVVGPDPDSSGPIVPTAVQFQYDGGGRLQYLLHGTVPSQSDSDWGNFSQAYYILFGYEAANRLTYQSRGPSGQGAISYTQYAYDNDNRVMCSAVRLNSAVFASLPSACSLSTQGLDGPDRVTYRSYTAADDLSQVISGYGTAAARSEGYTYNTDGTLGGKTDGKGNASCYSYDGYGRLSARSYPQPSNGGACNSSDYNGYTYDAASNVASRRLRDGTTFTYTYDALNRATSDGTTSSTYDNVGRLKSGGLILLTYDALGRKTGESNVANQTLVSAYDAAGDRIRLTWPDGNYVTYVYDPLGRVTQIEENGATSGAALLAFYTYNSLGQITNAAYAGNASTLGQSLAYDGVGRLGVAGYTFGDTSKNTLLSLNFTADSRLKLRTQSNNLYDWSGGYNTTLGYQINGLNQITSNGNAFSYDARGSLHSDSASTYSYSVYSQLTGVSGAATATLTYDGLHRLKTTVGSSTTKFGYDGAMIAEEFDSSNNLLRRYVPGPDGTPLWYEGSGLGDRRWLLKDPQGSVMAVANASGQTLAINTYDPYGLAGSSNLGRFQYAGRPFIPEAGLYDNAARSYSPTLGRFLQTDPIGYGDGMNWYAYTHGDPVNGTDPSGLGNANDKDCVQCTPGDNGPQESAPPMSPFQQSPQVNVYINCGNDASYAAQHCGLGASDSSAPNTDGPGARDADKAGPQGNTAGEVVVTAKRMQVAALPPEEEEEIEAGLARLFGEGEAATGRSKPGNLNEQLAMQQARANPRAGRPLPVPMTDPRWPASDGWEKMSQNINGIEIHYVFNVRTGAAADFKFK